MTGHDFLPLVSTVGSGFVAGAFAGYALKKVVKILVVIIWLFVAALAYLEYQRIIQVDWILIQALSQNGITMDANAVTHISNNIGADYTGALSNLGIPLAASASVGFALGMVRG